MKSKIFITVRDAYNALRAVHQQWFESSSSMGLVVPCELWAAAGEYMPRRPEYNGYTPTPVQRSMGTLPKVVNSTVAAHTIIRATLSHQSLVAVCGSRVVRKSTMLPAMLAQTGGKSVTVVVTSIITALQLSKYMYQRGYAATCVTSSEDWGRAATLYYTSAAVLVDSILASSNYRHDLLMLDVFQAPTPVLSALLQLLSTKDMPLVLVHALVPKTWTNWDVSELSSYKKGFSVDRYLPVDVGPVSGRDLGIPPTLLYGGTYDCRLLIDSGLRLDPRVKDGRLVVSLRSATSNEQQVMFTVVPRVGAMGGIVVRTPSRIDKHSGSSWFDRLLQMYSSAGSGQLNEPLWDTFAVEGSVAPSREHRRDVSVVDAVESVEYSCSCVAGLPLRKWQLTDSRGGTDLKFDGTPEAIAYMIMAITRLCSDGQVVKCERLFDGMPELSQVDGDDVRRVLAGVYIPTFSEQEQMAVLDTWDRVSRANAGKADNRYCGQFESYFQRYVTMVGGLSSK